MKKTYKKPYAYIEKFELSEHIAKCDFDYQNDTTPQNCYATGELTGNTQVNLFLDSTTSCMIDDFYCSHNSTAENVTFDS